MQPALWICFLVTFIIYQYRIKNERLNFRIAINRDFYEGRHLVKNGFLFGLCGSGLFFLLGVGVPMQWIIVYEILICLGLLLFLFIDSGIFTLLVSLPLLFFLQQITTEEFSLLKKISIDEQVLLTSGRSLFILTALFFLFRYLMLRHVNQYLLVPSIHEGKRGRRLIKYTWQESALVPLLILIPGDTFHSMVNFWPVFMFHGQKFELFILPFWITGTIKFWRQPLTSALKKVRKQAIYGLGYSVAFIVLTSFWPRLSVWGLLLLVVLLGIQAFLSARKDRREGRWYAETKSGVRVVAVQPHTPAAKMNLNIGDVIISCNGVKVANEEELYAALKLDSTYCHFKIRTYEGELKLAESAIFADSPHEIGLIIFH